MSLIPELYILLVNYNGYRDTIECLASIYKQHTVINIQTIIVDNSISDTDVKKLIQWAEKRDEEEIVTKFPEYVYPLVDRAISYAHVSEESLIGQKFEEELLIIRARSNNGFAAANNIGLRYIQSVVSHPVPIWILNNDTVLATNTVQELVKSLKDISGTYKKNGLFGTPLLDYDKANEIQAIGGRYHKLSATSKHVGEGMIVSEIKRVEDYKIDYPVGASMIIFTPFLEEVGMLNEEYFLFFEEMDWVERLKRKKGIVQILNVLGVYHKQGNTTQSNSKNDKPEFIDQLFLRNRVLFTKNYYNGYIWSVILFIIVVSLPKRIIKGQFDRIPKIVTMVFTTYFGKKRKAI